MINSASHQAWLFYSPLSRQAALLKVDLLDPVDQLLEDPALLDLVRQCLATRSPASVRTGRPTIAPDRLLRCCVMKHLKGWSFRDLERELRSNLVYRRFTRFDAEATPDFSTFSRTFALLSPQITEQIHQRVVGLAREQGVAQGRKLRTDTTVVESNVHYPTDSTLLGDGIQVLSRGLARIAAECKDGALEVVNHGRAVKHRLLEISRAAKSLTEANQQRMRDSYQKLVGLTRIVVRQPNEFGRLVRIDEVENGIVSAYQVLPGNPADTTAWMPALQHHQACFGRAPVMATADRGFFSAKNERAAQDLGVKKVALPARGRLSVKRAKQQKQRWFRRALRWRAGCEATISTLKHPFSMLRARYKKDPGFQRYVGWCVITKNLFSIARYQERRRGGHGQIG